MFYKSNKALYIEVSSMNIWRKHKGKFEKVNGEFLGRLFDWWGRPTAGEFNSDRLRMAARARKIMRVNRLNDEEEI